jgi:hypothetical protein
MFPAGQGGILLLGLDLYALSIVGLVPEEGEPVTLGYRLRKDTGESYDVPVTADSCECLGHLRHQCECKHIAAVRQLRVRRLI